MSTKKVKFVLAADIVANASNCLLLGEFNNWDLENGFSLKKSKDGSMTATIDLEEGRSYEYRYLLEGVRWENDHTAHAYAQVTGLDIVNCVVHVPVVEEKAKKPAAAAKAKPAGKKVTVPAAPKAAAKKTAVKAEKKAPAKAEAKVPAAKKKAAPRKEK